MKVILKPSLAEQIDKELIAAKEQGRTVDSIELTEKELDELLACHNLATKCVDASRGAYTYKGIRISFTVEPDDCKHESDELYAYEKIGLQAVLEDSGYLREVEQRLMTDTVKVGEAFATKKYPLSREEVVFNLCK